MELPIRWVASYLAVYEHGHYGRAAHALNLSTSAVSKHVTGLERTLHTSLLTRAAGSSVEPTPTGHRFAVAASELLDAHAAAAAAVRTRSPQRVARLGILAGLPFCRAQLEYVRAAVALRCPGWVTAQRSVPFDQIAGSLVRGDVDVLWTGEAPRHPALSAVQIGTLPRVGLVARGSFEGRTSISATTFAEQPLLYNPGLPPEWMSPMCMDDVRPLTEARLVATAATDFDTVVDLVARGDGMAVSGTPDPRAVLSRVTMVRLEGLPSMRVHAAFRRTDRREVVAALVTALGGARIADPLVSPSSGSPVASTPLTGPEGGPGWSRGS